MCLSIERNLGNNPLAQSQAEAQDWLFGQMSSAKNPNTSLSVVIPAYNAEKTLEDCVNSIVSAFPIEKEIIVVDDGSTDKTYQVASGLPVKLFRLKDNEGQSAAKNLGLVQAIGQVVAFVDSDVIVERNYFLELVSVLEGAEGNIGGVSGVIYPMRNNLISTSLNLRFFGCSPFSETKVRDIARLSGAASAFPKSVLTEAGGFSRETKGEDLDLSLRLRKAKYRLLLVPSAKVYHPHPASLTQLAKKWFHYGILLFHVSIKNHFGRDFILSWGWVLSCMSLFAVACYSGSFLSWIVFLLTFWLPWLLYYGKETFKFWVRNPKIKYLALPFVHQVTILARSLGVVVASIDHLLGKRQG